MKKLYTLFSLLLISSFAFSQIEGSWKIAPSAQALAVGPGLGDFSWWANTQEDVEGRACFFDDQYVFNADGSFSNELGGSTWLEMWQGVTDDQCGEPVAPHDGSGDATWSYDENAGTITLTGVGAYLGLPKVINGGELGDPSAAPSSVEYPVVLSDDGKTMTIDINFGPGFWHFVLVKDGASSTVDNDLAKFDFFPNPASDMITVSTDNKVDVLTVRSLDGTKAIVRNNPSQNERIDVSQLVRGVYILESMVDGAVIAKKIIIQ